MNKHEKTKRILKILGISLTVIGLGFAIWGLIDFFTAFGTEEMPKYFWALFVGLPLIGIGIGLTSVGFHREIASYVKNESIPVVKDAYKEITPELKDIIATNKEETKTVICKECGTKNEVSDKFCSNCGKKL